MADAPVLCFGCSQPHVINNGHPETRDNKWRAEGMRKMFQEQGISLEPEAPHPA